jgi:hypothetical protein
MADTKKPDTRTRDRETEEELAEVLTAISVVSKRLARKLTQLDPEGQDDSEEEGGNPNGKDE